MSINDILNDDMKRIVNELCKLVNLCKRREETLQSLVILNSNNLQLKNVNDIPDKCKEWLLGIASSNGIIRLKIFMLVSINLTEIPCLKNSGSYTKMSTSNSWLSQSQAFIWYQTKENSLKFPFSIYFMDQINKFKRLYQQDLEILAEEENYDEKTGELKAIIVNDCI
ncbi:hypothetical protein C2G38_2040550 [Gigaspora rosea]|uniref:Uncharacterized protein n=1 Tax=Gigaspora rosea TaxID=44941 RepID=A0A397UUS0_9GLOM|nr:hypothetical protein C2G38_2040550 [Gigaspora rosea]